MPCPSHYLWLYHYNYIRRSQVMNLTYYYYYYYYYWWIIPSGLFPFRINMKLLPEWPLPTQDSTNTE
jgi:hypothetical protein